MLKKLFSAVTFSFDRKIELGTQPKLVKIDIFPMKGSKPRKIDILIKLKPRVNYKSNCWSLFFTRSHSIFYAI